MMVFCAARGPVVICCCKTMLSLAITAPSAQVSDEYRDLVTKCLCKREVYQETPPKLRVRCSTCAPPRVPSSRRKTKRSRPPARRPHASPNRYA